MPAHVQDRHWAELGVAVLLAAVLTLAWTFRDWANLSALRLPDTDDMVRLQQIRDWLAGQPFGDLAQHRLGPPPGLEMHWSRLPDLVPGAIIFLLSPMLGAHAAELVAVVAWPALLFAATLTLVARIARTLGASGPFAAVIAALAYPATTVFVPGRIDHHGLQMVLLLIVAQAAIGRGSLGSGAAAGLATAASLAIGLETVPLLAVAGAAIVASWTMPGREAQARLSGYAVSLALALAAASVALRTSGWTYLACDGFTLELWRAAQFAALALLALPLVGFAAAERRIRVVAGLGVAVVAAGGALALSPGCLHPYGAVDPLLARLWLGHVAEAQPLFRAPFGQAFGYAGLMFAGIAATLWAWRRTRDARWLVLLALLFTAALVTLAQLRGAYAGALLAAPALAAVTAAARGRGIVTLAGAWLLSAGLLYPILGNALASRASAAPGVASADCTDVGSLAALRPGTLMGSIDLGAYALAATPHRVIAAPYHRNDAGNRAMYRFFLDSADDAHVAARRWRIDYIAFCAGDFAELGSDAVDPDALAVSLNRRAPPAWLRRLSPLDAPLGAYAVVEPR